ncbi:exodeoxyribonuclease VII small subunit [archaeon]|jgi:exodeoxyribonuclease VII small subunit|nr:exodeoxyribonuclease VII small subunit [archaeon]MBT3451517.1 exodeoxyribonuclease VII small subunit [archaeon]MBT6869513.1 exodeoxyribonuclease VII small subunit [archaeon]MBT7193201.1 exodeoxyribonuclease VII small subunit [archaeon]MBT7380507.1 exodeoxyribonuclease VII small subunit [archaeon]
MKIEQTESFEDKIQRIEQIVNKMEEGNLKLEENIYLFKEGSELTKQCQEEINKAELLIQKVIENAGKIEFENC